MGNRQWKKARNAYINKFKDYHSGLALEERGLIVDDEHPYIRVSPDVYMLICFQGYDQEEGVSAWKISYLESVLDTTSWT